MRIRTGLITMLVCLVILVALTACSQPKATAVPTAISPSSPVATVAAAADGAALLESRCSVCHSADRPKSKKNTRDQWDAIVKRMVGKGAKLTAAEQTTLIDHLAKNYGP